MRMKKNQPNILIKRHIDESARPAFQSSFLTKKNINQISSDVLFGGEFVMVLVCRCREMPRRPKFANELNDCTQLVLHVDYY